jgi:hypothetical protein
MEYQGQHEEGHHKKNMMFCCGTALRRGQGEPEPVITDAQGSSKSHGVSYDAAMFPFLHPGGLGAFRNGESLSAMLQQRVQQLFSPFTLMKEYVLIMFQVSCMPGMYACNPECLRCFSCEQCRIA